MRFHLRPAGLPSASEVFDSYWYFACERQRMYFRRLAGDLAVTSDPILAHHRFTNAYRVADRVSQYLIAEVIPGSHPTAEDIFFRTLLFKIFNKIDTWRHVVAVLGEPHWRETGLEDLLGVLEHARSAGRAIYSAAYIMPSPPFGGASKASNHLMMLQSMLQMEMHKRWTECRALGEVYQLLLTVPSLGSFLAFQFAIDLCYSDVVPADEGSFVIAGPGARSGIQKCFPGNTRRPEEIIMAVTEAQQEELARRELDFTTLWGRALQPIDCQNLFCEVDKYARVAHPAAGGSGRTRIKQTYRPLGSPLPPPVFPKSWNLQTTTSVRVPPAFSMAVQ